jgi:hypothetical protein
VLSLRVWGGGRGGAPWEAAVEHSMSGVRERRTGKKLDGEKKGAEGNDREQIRWTLTHRYLSV